MGSKIFAIFLLVIGLGIGLYFYNSGGAAKLGSVMKPPSGTAPASSTISPPANASATRPASSATSAAPSSFGSFLTSLFAVLSGKPGGSFIGPSLSAGSSGAGAGGQPSSNSGGSTGTAGGPSTSSIPASDIPQGYTLAQLSPYFHMVRLSGVGGGQISLYTNVPYGEATATIDITGWEIKTNRSGEFVPQAVNIYDPSAAAALSDIFLTTGGNDSVYLYSNSGPVNLRLNECMGYLNATQQFNPPLPYSCPQVHRSQIQTFSGQCQNYILSLGCQPVNMASPQIPQYDYQCQQYLENNFTYHSCIENHATDQNFLSNTWYIWMGSSPLDPYHDNVALLDRNGLVVDAYSY